MISLVASITSILVKLPVTEETSDSVAHTCTILFESPGPSETLKKVGKTTVPSMKCTIDSEVNSRT